MNNDKFASGSELDLSLTMAMYATVNALYEAGHISSDVAEEFNNTHVCVLVTSDSVWKRISSWLGLKFKHSSMVKPTVFKVAEPKYSVLEIIDDDTTPSDDRNEN